MADYSGGPSFQDYKYQLPDLHDTVGERFKRALQDKAYETYRDNIEFSLQARLDELVSERDAEMTDKSPGEEPDVFEYEVIYRVTAYNPLHAVTLAHTANNIEVRLKPWMSH